MSSSARPAPVPASAPAPGVATDKKKGSLLSRMKTVLKKADGSRRLSFSSKTPAAGPSTTKAAGPTPIVDSIKEEGKKTAPRDETMKTSPQPTKVIRSEIDAERARKLGERFKVTLDPQQFSSKKVDREVYRVEKPIRMRIHRQCHQCHTVFGGNKICTSCQHVRCKACPRSPTKKAEENKDGEHVPTTISGPNLEPDTYWGPAKDPPLTKPNPNPGRQPLVRKQPMQRVRRTCCECSALFIANSKACQGCSHGRCAGCPRDPAKKKKFPNGYPGDAPSKDTSIPVKYSCHNCMKVFPPVPPPSSGETTKQDCVRCGHERCNSCTLAPIVKIEPVPDPEIVKRVEAKLAALNIDTTSAAS